jgi:hypothetical protein
MKLIGVQTFSVASSMTLYSAAPPDRILTRSPQVTACRGRDLAPRLNQSLIKYNATPITRYARHTALEIFSITTIFGFPSTMTSTSSSSPLPSNATPIGWLTCTTPSSGLLVSVLRRKRRIRLSSKRTITMSPGSTTSPGAVFVAPSRVAGPDAALLGAKRSSGASGVGVTYRALHLRPQLAPPP